MRIIGLPLAALAAPSLALAQVQNLGALPAGTFSASLTSSDGSVIVGTAETPGGRLKVGLWTESDALAVFDTPSPDSFIPSELSRDGRFVVGSRVSINTVGIEENAATVWDTSTGVRFEIDPLPGDFRSRGRLISEDGSTVVGISLGAAPGQRVFRWDAAGGAQDIGSFGGSVTRVAGMTPDGLKIVGSSEPAQGPTQAYIWSASTGMQPIAALAGFESRALAISDDGNTVIGSTSHPSFPSGAFYSRVGLGTIELNLGGGTLGFGIRPGLSADGLTASVTVDFPGTEGLGAVWTLGGGATLLSPDLPVTHLSLSADGDLIAGSFGLSADPSDTAPFLRSSATGLRMLLPLADSFPTSAVSISADGSTVVGGGTLADGREVGARWHESELLGESFCGPAMPHSLGYSASMSIGGSNTVGERQLFLRAGGVVPGSFGFFLVSDTADYVFPVAGSDGALCLGGQIGRFVGPGQVQQANPFGDLAVFVDSAQIPSPSGPFAPAPGTSLYFQAWFRDSTPTGASNFSSGATVRFY